jgi:molybdopterin-guanine dinucleotide biosynthesis protein A
LSVTIVSRPARLDVDAAILAGGQARRFGGRDKAALVIQGLRVLDRQLEALRQVTDRIVIVGGSIERFADAGVPIIADRTPALGPLGGICTALEYATSHRTLILACDLPFVTAQFLAYLAETARECEVTMPRTAHGVHPLCAAWATTAAPMVSGLVDQGVRKVRDVVARLRVHIVEGDALNAFDPDGRLLHNINTPDDYARALASRA